MSEWVFWGITIIYCIVLTTNTIGWKRTNRAWGQTLDDWNGTIEALAESNRENEQLAAENLMLKARFKMGADDMTVLRDESGHVLHIHLSRRGEDVFQA